MTTSRKAELSREPDLARYHEQTAAYLGLAQKNRPVGNVQQSGR